MQTLKKARRTQDHCMFFAKTSLDGDNYRTTVMHRRLNPTHQEKDITTYWF